MLPRFVKRGDADTKALAKKISANATLATKKKAEAGKAAALGTSQAKESKPAETKQVPPVAGVKRERTGDLASTQPAKKVAAESPTANPVTKETAAKPSTTSTPSAAAATAPAKPKTNTVTPKASGFFSLQSASKRPGTSIAAQASTTKSVPAAR